MSVFTGEKLKRVEDMLNLHLEEYYGLDKEWFFKKKDNVDVLRSEKLKYSLGQNNFNGMYRIAIWDENFQASFVRDVFLLRHAFTDIIMAVAQMFGKPYRIDLEDCNTLAKIDDENKIKCTQQ